MIVCRKCSRRYEDGTEFCSCGAYLAFDGERVAGAPDSGRPRADASPTSQKIPAPPSPRPAAEPAPWSGLPGTPSWQAPPTDELGVVAQLPDTPTRQDTTAPMWVEQGPRTGDEVCRTCGTANAPTLEFCRHCGAPLRQTTSTAGHAERQRPSWWRRMVRTAGREAQQLDPTHLAGSARMSSNGVAGRVRLFRGGMVAVVLLGLLAFLGPWRTPLVNAARSAVGGQRFDTVDRSDFEVAEVPTPVTPPTNPAENVADSFANTTWATTWTGSEAPGTVVAPTDGSCLAGSRTSSSLQFTFAEPTSVDKLGILAGRHADDASAGSFSRPRVVELAADGRCTYVVLQGAGELEIHDVDLGDVTVVDVRVVDLVPESEQSANVEIAEIVFGRD